MSPPPGAGGVGLGVPIPHGLPFPLPISGLPRSRRQRRVPPPIHPPPASIGSIASVDSLAFQGSPGSNAGTDMCVYASSQYGDGDDHDHGVEVEIGLEGDGSICTLEEDDPPGGKKRKVPIALVPGSEADVESGRDGADRNPPRSAREDNGSLCAAQAAFPIVRRFASSTSAKLLAQRRALFQKRKAGMVALYLDAQAAVKVTRDTKADKDKDGAKDSSCTKDKDANSNSDKSATPKEPSSPDSGSPTSSRLMPLPDVGAFERLLPVLEDIDAWAPDAPGWRDGDDAAHPVPRRTLERWRTGFARRKRMRTERIPVVRGGWAPEGSFELDIPTTASTRTRARARERIALARLAEQLRALVLATNKVPTQTEVITAPPVPTPLSQTDPTPLGKKTSKKKKKKKRTALANEGNPHHVDKYRPSRPVPVSDPYEPWPHHVSLLFPPPMKVLAARPGGKDLRPGEDENICFSCQYALFYGSEAQRKLAIKQRRAELARREKLRARVYDVTHGSNRTRRHGSDAGSNDGDGDHGDEEDDDDYEDEEDDEHCASGHGRCTCGRALKDEPVPPDKPP